MTGLSPVRLPVVARAKRWSLTLTGLAAIALSLSYYAANHDAPLYDGLVTLVPLSVACWVALVGYRVGHAAIDPNRVWRLTDRTVLGAAVTGVGLVSFVLLFVSSVLGPDAVVTFLEYTLDLGGTVLVRDVLLHVLIAIVVGAGGGLLVGLYEDRMSERARELKRVNERLDEFAAVVSHDLRNPLTVAELNLHLARETGEQERFEAVERAHTRMEELIDDVLTLARDGDEDLTPSLVDVSEAARDAWETTDTRDGTLDVKPVGTLRADPARLKTLFENLFRNALDHGGPETTVEVGPLATGGFYVADDGPGIPADERAQVFEAGYTTSKDGTGFGLAIVKRIAEAHGWQVVVADPAQSRVPVSESGFLSSPISTEPVTHAADLSGARFEFRTG
ncbi:sensor histidine kinase [Haloarchaeobius sp. DFWS5]|uniref:sensor histidine kinase n=1 Tax=Haloarchaeobius sp. DFWS5 TaxID=3446114 RepID=UPI003EBEAE85